MNTETIGVLRGDTIVAPLYVIQAKPDTELNYASQVICHLGSFWGRTVSERFGAGVNITCVETAMCFVHRVTPFQASNQSDLYKQQAHEDREVKMIHLKCYACVQQPPSRCKNRCPKPPRRA